MKKLFPSIFLLSLLFNFTSSICAQTKNTDTVLVFHPTVNTLSMLNYLVDKKILDPGDIHFMGVYHEGESYDYSESEELIESLPAGRYSLYKIGSKLCSSEVYSENNCTAEFHKLFKQSVGALFFGGPDMPPALYGEESSTLTIVSDPGRHYLELSYIFHVLGRYGDGQFSPFAQEAEHYVISGICLGMQSINVATGGTLIQDIPLEVYNISSCETIVKQEADAQHRNYLPQLDLTTPYATSYHFHRIVTEKDGPLDFARSIDDPFVLSSHHQGVEKPGEGIKVAARSEDGKIVEALSHSRYDGVIGVQFHPENTALYNSEIVNTVAADSTISFAGYIKDQHSEIFHLEYWSLIGQMLRSSSASH